MSRIKIGNIVKMVGTITVTTSLVAGMGVYAKEVTCYHPWEVCPITEIENAIGLDGYNHQMQKIEEDYLKTGVYQTIDSEVVTDYLPRYLSNSELTSGRHLLVNLDTGVEEMVDFNKNNYRETYVCVRYYNENIYTEPMITNNGFVAPNGYKLETVDGVVRAVKIVTQMELVPVAETHDRNGKKVYKVPENGSLRVLYEAKEPLKAIETEIVEADNTVSYNHLLVK